MKIYSISFLLLAILLLFTSNSVYALNAKEQVFAKILYSFNSGDYITAIKRLDKIKSKEFGPISHYWKGICLGKLQRYDEAVEEYKTAVKMGATPKDIYYEMGQAYYSMLDYPKAKEAFKQSILKRFKVNESFYYMGYIDLSREKFQSSVRLTKRIIELKTAPKELMQAAYFQLGEAYLGNIEKNTKRISKGIRLRVKKYVLPMYEKALEQKNDNSFATHIYTRQAAVRKKYGVKKKTFYNGKPFPKKYTKAYIAQKASYDSNVILESSSADSQSTNKSSWIMDTNAYINTMAVHRRRLIFKPELLVTHSYYANRDNFQVYQNDTLSLTPALITTLEHRMRKRPANFNIELSVNHTKRRSDAPTDKALKKYGNTVALSLSEEMEFFPGTLTTFKYTYKQFSAVEDTNSTRENGIYASHSIFNNKGFSYFLDLGFNVIDASNDSLSSNEIITRLTMFRPKTLFGHDLLVGLGITVKDMKKMKDTRGTEVKYAPFLILSRTYAKKWTLAFNYSLNKQTSDMETIYAYTQNIFGVELKYNFF